MATAGPQTDTENYDLECAVCTEILRDARLLRCGHHFCKVCLEQIADRHPQRAVPCPTCRHVTNIQDKTGVAALPKYAATTEFSRKVRDVLKREDKNVKPRKCDSCMEAEACKACPTCCISLCNSCTANHSNLEDMDANHKVYPMSNSIFCSTHTSRMQQAFCLDCGKLCCPVCIIGKHQGHKLDKIYKRAEYIQAELREKRDHMDAAEMETEAAHRLQETLDRAVSLQNTFITSTAGLKQSLKDMLSKVEILGQEIGEKLEASIKLLKGMNTDMKDYMVSKIKLRDHMTYMVEKASDFDVITQESEVPLYNTDTYKHVISTTEVELPELGTTLTDIQAQLDKLSQQLEMGYTTYHLCNEGSTGAQHDNRPLTDLAKVMDIDVGIQVFGLAVDSGKQRLVVLRCDATAPVSVYNVQGQRLQVMGQGVEGITGVSCHSIAIDTKRDLKLVPMNDGSLVTMDMNGTVQDKMKVTSEALYGVSYSNEDIYVTSTAITQIYLINPKTKQTLNTFSTNTTFNAPYNVCTGQFTVGGNSTPVIMVSNYNSHCIKVLDLTGHLLHTYGKQGKPGGGEGELNYPWGVCTDPDGRLIVGDTNNKRVVSFWTEGDRDMSQVLLGPDKLNVSGHMSVAIDPVSRKLFVGNHGLNTLQVFQG